MVFREASLYKCLGEALFIGGPGGKEFMQFFVEKSKKFFYKNCQRGQNRRKKNPRMDKLSRGGRIGEKSSPMGLKFTKNCLRAEKLAGKKEGVKLDKTV